MATTSIGVMAGRPTAGSVMAANRGAGPGFDWCRIGLSMTVVLFHSALMSEPAKIDFMDWKHPFITAILPMFFGLSGFLVTGSALRLKNVWTFLTFRVLRIVPALMVEVTLSALVLGPLLTVVPLGRYFQDRAFYSYFGNIIGWIHFRLPGVFLNNPFPEQVNSNLWTLHPEFLCYGMMAALIVSGLVYSRRIMTIVWVAATIVGLVINLRYGLYVISFRLAGTVLTYCFLTGVVAYHWRDWIVLDWRLFVAAIAVSYGLIYIPQAAFIVPVFLTYAIVWLGMQHYPRIELLQRGDYSYGIYLYGAPLQQTIVLLFPALRHWYIVFPLSLVLVTMLAALSWHFVEKPALRLKKHILRGPPKVVAPVLGQA